jgi:hypothetical protein
MSPQMNANTRKCESKNELAFIRVHLRKFFLSLTE